MANAIVSIRLPVSMVNDFRKVSEKDHFLDLSEAIRSVVRDRWLEFKNPDSYQIKKLRKEISESFKDEIIKKNHEYLLKEMKEIRRSKGLSTVKKS